MSAVPMVLLVARREILVRLRSRTVVGSTLVMVALVVIGIGLYAVVGGHTTTLRVGFSGGSQALERNFSASLTALGQSATVSNVADEAAGRSLVSRGTLDVLVTGPATSPTLVVQQSASAVVQAALEQAVLAARFTAAGIPPGVLETVISGAQAPVDVLAPKPVRQTQDRVIGLGVAILLWIALGLSGSMVANGVVEEKATRIMEILLATVPPTRLLAGKVAGIGLIGLGQLAIVAAATIAAVDVTHVVTTPALGVEAILGYLLWFLLGYLLYATGYATMAALVSRQEEVQSAVAPINVFAIAAYLLAYVALVNPTSPLITAVSVLPPFAPILMPVRLATGDLPAWQGALALALTLAAIAGLIWVAGRVYANSATRIGARVRFV